MYNGDLNNNKNDEKNNIKEQLPIDNTKKCLGGNGQMFVLNKQPPQNINTNDSNPDGSLSSSHKSMSSARHESSPPTNVPLLTIS
jgi:hypothetical protein